MFLDGLREGLAVGVFTVVLPDDWEKNVDLFDGPGNSDLDLTAECSALRICGEGAKCKGVSMVEFRNDGPDGFVEFISKGVTYFSGMVPSGGTFMADASPGKFGANSEIWVEGMFHAKVPTSCDKPIYIGMTWNDFTLVDVAKVYDEKESIDPSNMNILGLAPLASGAAPGRS
jgi:hypothetical protein